MLWFQEIFPLLLLFSEQEAEKIQLQSHSDNWLDNLYLEKMKTRKGREGD